MERRIKRALTRRAKDLQESRSLTGLLAVGISARPT